MSQHTLLTALTIVRAGWTKGNMSKAGCHCLLGALAEANGLTAADNGQTYGYFMPSTSFSHPEAVADVKVVASVIRERIAAISPHMPGQWREAAILNPKAEDYEVCYDYNDSSACTQGDVELVLSEAARRSASS